ncbi:ornithine cyclodeaminase/mu-crystallin family protein [Oscillibacter valericigenes Sjm18-20]|nr:ornithine cyclodeaminase/mu-crystallin family protein [Oscillibacter valericigenes Sjm18-20]
MTKVFNVDEVKSLITMKDVVESVEKTFCGLADGTVINPTKVTLDMGESAPYPPYEGFFNAMPAYIGYQDYAGIKWVGGILGERKKAGLPFICGMILLANPRLGKFLAVMDGAYITNLRTGAQTAVSLRHIFKDRKKIKLGLYGCGMQGHTQTLAISEVFDIEEMRIYDAYPPAAEKFKDDMKDVVKGEIIICKDARDACIGDAVITVTQAKDGFMQADWVKPGTVVFPMGSYKEVDDEVILQADSIVVDHIGQALHRGALHALVEQGRLSEKNITTTIGELALGTANLGDVSDKRIVCIPIGTGAMDVAVAGIVYERGIARGMGVDFNITGE